MEKEKKLQQEEEMGKTRVMSLSTLSTEIKQQDEKGKSKGDTAKKKAITKQPQNVQPKIKLEKEIAVNPPVDIMPIKQVKQENLSKSDISTSQEIEKPEKDVEVIKDEGKVENKDENKVEKLDQDKNAKDVSVMKEKASEDLKTNVKDKDARGNESNTKELKQEQEKEIKVETKKQEKENKDEHETPQINSMLSEASEKKQEKLTLEEKRRNERSKLMTIEEKRALQKEGKLPSAVDEKKKISNNMGKVDYILLILSMLMSWFVTYRIFTYFAWGYALAFFLFVHSVFVGIFFLSKKKRKLGLGINIGVSILILILSLLMLKINSFTDQIFDNSESESVMLVAKKDSTISDKDDFKDKKIAFIKSDGDTNSFAKEMLSEAKKETYEEIVYVTYKEAYEALLNNDIDMMVYTSFTKQRLLEDDLQSWDEVKVIMQKSRSLKAVESKNVDISKDPFNIYISGVDLTSDSINEKGSSDVNIILTVNPSTKKIIMQTIPRDTWTGLTCSNGESTKLTYAGAYGGIDCSIKTIEEYIGIEINYYAKINFQGVIDLVDALDGITVESDVSFCESHPVEGYGVKNYCYNAGTNTLDGINALMFARIRKVFSDGDVERGRHQMEVVNAVIRKFNESPSLGNINALLGAVENNFTTNLKEDDIGKGFKLLLEMQEQATNIETLTMEGELVWKTDEVTSEYLYYFIPNDGQVDIVKQRIQDVMDGK